MTAGTANQVEYRFAGNRYSQSKRDSCLEAGLLAETDF